MWEVKKFFISNAPQNITDSVRNCAHFVLRVQTLCWLVEQLDLAEWTSIGRSRYIRIACIFIKHTCYIMEFLMFTKLPQYRAVNITTENL